MRGDGAPGGAAVVGSISASPCEDAEAPPGAPPEHLLDARAHLRSSSSASPTVVNGIPAPGRAFRFRACRACRSVLPSAGPLWVAVERQMAFRQTAGRLTSVSQLLAGGSYWPPGGAPAPPECWEERSSPARGRRILLHHQTPLDDAPRSSRTPVNNIHIGIKSRGRIAGLSPLSSASASWQRRKLAMKQVRCRQDARRIGEDRP